MSSQSQPQPSSGSKQSESSQQQQQQQRVRKPPFADWPTIKILTPPQGRFSPKVDEWCLTYCTQTVSGRIHGRESNCRSICIRKVFPHEVRNIVSFKRHSNVDAEGKAHYPLPAEGQPVNLPRLLGGKAPEDPDDQPSSSKSSPNTRNWEEGWYLWTSSSRRAALERMQLMSFDLEKQNAYRQQQEQRKEVWQDFQDRLKQGGVDKEELAQRYGGKFSGSIFPPHVSPEDRAKSMLLHIPPEWPSLWERIDKLLAPSRQVLSIFKESLLSGEHKQFALRVWEKARTDEPFVLARRTLTRTYERWKEKDATDEDDSKKGST
ncbi:hypothetical protein CC1G_01957 [Coprinopsis cinerea okayama7|uniref:Uncharacterized protein n=1 Tax=Coprinopsis cinerea (strain Okayama-7 / 130 / ATCC MYA-4618 / FGSC 9003) TaxID=240176 RepID=A8N636_COPC7|nr:hypothetical protein CC1G_01957 [Coprinopsis cinerea okayama7\|eukprot:XP_001830321.1 hypothetical protein CC1G_01957 [Coprinopsis cinerea okayama7\